MLIFQSQLFKDCGFLIGDRFFRRKYLHVPSQHHIKNSPFGAGKLLKNQFLDKTFLNGGSRRSFADDLTEIPALAFKDIPGCKRLLTGGNDDRRFLKGCQKKYLCIGGKPDFSGNADSVQLVSGEVEIGQHDIRI